MTPVERAEAECEKRCKKHACALQECFDGVLKKTKTATGGGIVKWEAPCQRHAADWNECCDSVKKSLGLTDIEGSSGMADR